MLIFPKLLGNTLFTDFTLEVGFSVFTYCFSFSTSLYISDVVNSMSDGNLVELQEGKYPSYTTQAEDNFIPQVS